MYQNIPYGFICEKPLGDLSVSSGNDDVYFSA